MPSKHRIRPRKTQRILSREALSLFPDAPRICAKCRGWFPRTEFYADKSVKDGLSSWCRYCRTASAILGRKKYLYGLEPAEFERMVAEQDNRCACCGDNMGHGKLRCVDHCHDTEKIRALLCTPCNVGIAMAKHDPERLRQMIAYLEKHL